MWKGREMGKKRSTSEQRGKTGRAGAKKKSPFALDMGLDFGLDLELDFDLSDFRVIEDEPTPGDNQEHVRILRPRIERRDITLRAAYENARAFARQIDLTPGARTFAWINGNFIFGDIVEALITERRVGIKRLYICSLSFSQENIDSLRNVMDIMGDELERLVLVFSGYQYSYEKYNLVPYMYQELDDPQNRVQIVFGRWHAKLMTMETVHGHTITIHGSANMRSSNSIEQIMIEVDDRTLHDFNAAIMDDIAERFGTINHGAGYAKLKPVENKEAWEIMETGVKEWPADQQAEAAAGKSSATLPQETGESPNATPP